MKQSKLSKMLIPIDDKELSWLYFLGTSRAAIITESLYDALHNNSGQPIDDVDIVKSIVDSHIKQIKAELEIIKTAAEERRGGDDHYIR
jgi:hypothetical protein